ncbi:cytidine deaminase [Shimwellia blattae]|uniref:Cytidine deaminase n=1 Tax=Shimwellia blattae (strain ATCC 29907 / DSM 4481 / JCM 1650 / NBRC 105725 / CDC 9005-74) TaxID=630626 RepID=I2B7F9_SHIBC|nr:cytidine deaminase [Shimwellia blattae]AFJ46463.1 cytidine deaminase Cdd [Shimwellia blattae DSM 4481 = NBRC 105725]GAB80044.1 cytidine deaminase [Shimwellia blattae DSM 4481 = NBRC 105725]VDY63931.1 Cytidine deaminase [Shimwellia blattae]VEC22067.1 Cytidine deaminase [Shimwellia blattae]
MDPRFEPVLAAMPAPLRSALGPLLAADHFPAMFSAATVAQLKQRSGLDDNALAFALLPLAAACAHTAISHFNVGAVARGVSGNLYLGANMEFPGTTMQQTIHAEQSAITHAWMRGERQLTDITVNYTPCGHCRQFMNELNSGTGLAIHLPGRQPDTLGHYLPDAFGPRDLEITTLLLDEVDHGLRGEGDALAQAAIAAANRSHAPYSDSPSGVALEMKDGTRVTGSYAENAAYNPSLPPLQAALNLAWLTGYQPRDIRRAVLAERASALLVQWDATVATLKSLGCTNIERVLPA